jgi:hypothetical protein
MRCLVFDLGGGTFDVTIIDLEGSEIHVQATAGDNRLGGKEWDDLLIDCKLAPLRELASDLQKYDDGELTSFPNLVWLEPSYSWTEFAATDPFYAEPNCDHPPADVMRGQALLQYVYDALRKSKLWERSALVVFYDEHGGFYDHVEPPPCIPDRDGFCTRGPRVPALVVSPYVQPGSIAALPEGQVFDHCSVIKFLCERFDIEPWTTRLRDPSTASLGLFFSNEARSDAPDSKLQLKDHPDLCIDLRSARCPSTSHEGTGMRILSRVLEAIADVASSVMGRPPDCGQ